jgi:hypothetical protein
MSKCRCSWLAAVLLLTICTLVAAEEKDRIVIGQATSITKDGRIVNQQMIYDQSTRSFRPLTASELDGIPARTWSTAVAFYCFRWNSGENGKVILSITQDMAPHKAAFNKIMKKYHNRLRGTKSMPQLGFDAKVYEVKDISEFQDTNDYYEQFWWDGDNLIWMTNDDQWFKDPTGQYWLYGENVVQYTITFLTREFNYVGGKWVADQYITEIHVYLRSNFFNTSKPRYTQSAVMSFAAAMGYRFTIWGHDLTKNGTTIYATETEILKTKSDVWTKINQPRDLFYYSDKPSGTPAAYLSTPRLLPFEGEVLDIGLYHVPSVDDNDPEPLVATESVFLTNLKAYDGKKKLSVNIDWLQTLPDNSTQWVALSKLQGNLDDYPWTYTINGQSQKVYLKVFGNMVFIGRQTDLDTMKDAVRDYGTPQTIDGIYFAKALKIRAQVKGRLEENGPLKTVTQEYWLVDTEANPLE